MDENNVKIKNIIMLEILTLFTKVENKLDQLKTHLLPVKIAKGLKMD